MTHKNTVPAKSYTKTEIDSPNDQAWRNIFLAVVLVKTKWKYVECILGKVFCLVITSGDHHNFYNWCSAYEVYPNFLSDKSFVTNDSLVITTFSKWHCDETMIICKILQAVPIRLTNLTDVLRCLVNFVLGWNVPRFATRVMEFISTRACVYLLVFTCCHFLFHFLQCHSQVNFVSTLLHITMTDQLDLPVRQAGKCEHIVPRK